jgi:hypothetical protein
MRQFEKRGQPHSEQIRLGANTAFFGLGLYEKEIRAGLAVRDSTRTKPDVF